MSKKPTSDPSFKVAKPCKCCNADKPTILYNDTQWVLRTTPTGIEFNYKTKWYTRLWYSIVYLWYKIKGIV